MSQPKKGSGKNLLRRGSSKLGFGVREEVVRVRRPRGLGGTSRGWNRNGCDVIGNPSGKKSSR